MGIMRAAVPFFLFGVICYSVEAASFEEVCGERTRQPVTAEELENLPNRDAGPGAQGPRVDFSNRDLRGKTISNKWLRNANLNGADLRDTDFVNTDLAEASFEGVCAVGASFENVDLRNATMRGANLDSALFRGASIRMAGARFDRASLADTEFGGLSLDNVNFAGAGLLLTNLEDASLVNTDITDALLRQTKIGGAVWQPKGVPDLDQLGPLSGVDRLIVDKELADLAPLVLLEGWLRERGYDTDADAARYARLKAETSILLGGQAAPLDPGNPKKWSLYAWLEGAFRWVLLEITIGYGYIPSRGIFAVFIWWLLFSLFYYFAFVVGAGQLFRVYPEGRIENGGTAGWTVAQESDLEVVEGGGCLAILRRASVVSLESTLRVGVGRFNLAEFVVPLRGREVRYDAYGWLRIVMGAQALIGSYLLLVTAFAFLRRYVFE